MAIEEVGNTPAPRLSLLQDGTLCLSWLEPLLVPSFPIHHPPQKPKPSDDYQAAIRSLITELGRRAGAMLDSTRLGFDPKAPLEPVFFQVFTHDGMPFLYLARVNLAFRLGFGRRLRSSTNTHTAPYETPRLAWQLEVLPLERHEEGAFWVLQLFDSTWLGEEGWGYRQSGQWMDEELGELFTRIVCPDCAASHPYRLLICHHRSLAAVPIRAGPPERLELARLLGRLVRRGAGEFRALQARLRGQPTPPISDLVHEARIRFNGLILTAPVRLTGPILAPGGIVEYLIDESLF